MNLNFLFIVVCMILASCANDPDISKDTTEEGIERIQFENFQFEYELAIDSIFEYATLAKCSLSNLGDDTLYYLTQSCNGLAQFCEVNESDFYIKNEIDCHVSWDVVEILAPKASYEFVLHLHPIDLLNTSKPKDLKLDLIALNRFISVEEIQEIVKRKKRSFTELLNAQD